LAESSIEVVAYMRTMPGSTQPDIKIHFVMALYEAMGRKVIKHTASLHMLMLNPDSAGELKLASADPLTPPLINPNILATERDMALGLSAIRAVRGIFAQRAFDGLRGAELAPGEAAQSDAELDAYLRATGSADIHTCGTCRMGRDSMAVVDPQLRVHGLGALRVVDASVMPRVPGGNTNVPTMMIAEKAADMILG
jgi:choline dehydrogenase